MTQDKLPKYIQNANRVLEILAEQPERVWDRPQRELAEKLGLALPEISAIVSTLTHAKRIRKGAPLLGVRGRTSALELLDPTPLTGSIPRHAEQGLDRALRDEEAIQGPVDLQTITMDQIGYAVMRTLRQVWDEQERNAKNRTQQAERLKEYRDLLNQERTQRITLTDAVANLERIVDEQDREINRMREEINNLLIRIHQRRQSNTGSVKVSELLDDSEIALLDQLMREKPGDYRKSDREVGLVS